ncbi:MAG TPA: tipN, partial [Caulobacteraceae bacterium]|nr:tipN [Caulobacteraceae bacterium]
DGLSQQRAALVQAGYALRTEQEDFSAQVETQRAQLAEALAGTQSAVAELNESSARGAEMLSSLVGETAVQARALADLTAAEREAFAARTRESLDRFAALAADARDDLVEETKRALAALTASAEGARKAADEAADAAQARIDNLGEAAFDAARRADEAFESRLTAARNLFEESSSLIDEAGERAAQRIEANMGELRSALAHIDEALAEIDGRAARLPAEAKARIEEIRASVEEGLESLALSARRAAEETQAVDAAFQDRVKRNYDMLSEAVKLMGLVSGGSPAPRPRPEPEVEPRRRGEPAISEASQSASAEAGLRGRLKLTPTATDEEFRSVFDGAAGKGDPEGWTWRDLLGGMGGPEAAPAEPVQDEALAGNLIEEIHRLGVDPNALLPRSRVEAAAEAIQAGSPDTAREIVRRVAPAAARRISRRVLTDAPLRAQTERYLSLFEARLAEAARKDPEGFATAALLGSEPGRTYLLIDAAIGDL